MTLCCLLLLVWADARVEVSVNPQQGARVGEPVVFSVELLTSKWFTAGPRLPELEVEGAVVRRLSTAGINATREIDGEQFTSQTWEYTVYPQRPGGFEIPALEVRMFPAESAPVMRTTEPVNFAVQPLPGGAALVAAAFTAEQSVEKADALKVGDSLTRTITLRTDGAPAMLIPPVGATEAEGMTAYPKTPRVDDRLNRGEVAGARVEAVSYLFEKPGRYRFPEIRIPWWNTKTKAIETVVLEGLEVEVAPNPEFAVAPATEPESSDWGWLATSVALLLIALALREPLGRARERWIGSEPAAFLALRRATGGHATYLALGAWLRRAGLEPDTGLRRQMDALGDHLYGGGGDWDRAALLSAARSLRRRDRHKAKTEALPPLNPTG